jgi:hypothetical protein
VLALQPPSGAGPESLAKLPPSADAPDEPGGVGAPDEPAPPDEPDEVPASGEPFCVDPPQFATISETKMNAPRLAFANLFGRTVCSDPKIAVLLAQRPNGSRPGARPFHLAGVIFLASPVQRVRQVLSA